MGTSTAEATSTDALLDDARERVVRKFEERLPDGSTGLIPGQMKLLHADAFRPTWGTRARREADRLLVVPVMLLAFSGAVPGTLFAPQTLPGWLQAVLVLGPLALTIFTALLVTGRIIVRLEYRPGYEITYDLMEAFHEVSLRVEHLSARDPNARAVARDIDTVRRGFIELLDELEKVLTVIHAPGFWQASSQSDVAQQYVDVRVEIFDTLAQVLTATWALNATVEVPTLPPTGRVTGARTDDTQEQMRLALERLASFRK